MRLHGNHLPIGLLSATTFHMNSFPADKLMLLKAISSAKASEVSITEKCTALDPKVVLVVAASRCDRVSCFEKVKSHPSS
jgi:hypothetical protein